MISVNDPGLITLVNKLQDVFSTVGVCCVAILQTFGSTVLRR
jgi:hypothetical protein